jgi:4-aminobutyrate aminotransferase-like enzyme/Ser/Thr protein kinase RdoA (MazF antagonist)
MTNPFESHAPTSPDIAHDALLAEVRRRYGITGDAKALGSHQDQNVVIDTAAGHRVLVKVMNAGYPDQEIEAQDLAMGRAAAAGLTFAVPAPIVALDGSLRFTMQDAGTTHVVRVLSWVEGEQFAGVGYLAPTTLERVGRIAGELAAALAGFDHPGLDRVIQWDLRQARAVVDGLVGSLPTDGRRDRARRSTTTALDAAAALADGLRMQAVHGDITTWNLVGRTDATGRLVPSGVIDFGDLVRSWLAADAAITICGVLEHVRGRALQAACHVLRGYHAAVPLAGAEIGAIWPLVRARAAVCAVSADHQLSLEPGNAYVASSRDLEWATFEEADAIADALAHEALRAALDLPPTATAGRLAAAAAQAGPVIAATDAPLLDLSITTDAIAPGAWVDPVAVAAAIGPGLALGCHAEARITHARPGPVEAPSVHLGADVFAPAGTPLVSPAAATVRDVGQDRIVLACAGYDAIIGGVDPHVTAGATVAAGDPIGTIAAASETALPAHVHLQVTLPGLAAPALAPPSLAAAWLALCPDPAALAGRTTTAAPLPAADLLRRRGRVLASAQERYYEQSPRIERGFRHHLYGTAGRAYVDMVNNVAGIGHSHAGLERAVSRQLRLLNTNSRFHYGLIVEYAERLAALLPDPLDTVFLVSTGSEANDLALRLASICTGRRDVLAVRSAYHGWTMATDAVTTSAYDNPRALETRPDWVHLVESPNTYRGLHRGADAAERYAADVARAIGVIQAAGRGVSTFIAEPLYGNAGGVELPPGYLREAYRLVREAGGLNLADEVQVGLGRTGEALWAFQREGVMPDIVTVAKAAGNGIGMGAVITSRELAERFRDEGSFFSSVGGSPVSCAAGLAVLDAIRDEGLQENARRVGAHMKARLTALGERHALVGAVHGVGLYLGVELVRDRVSLEPATEEAYAICDRLLGLGILVQPTSDTMNVLKVKPPLCIDEEAADLFVEALDLVLATGW